ncbi:adenylate/guanylate cyclase domain-containing protein [Argonema galeatum]|uniref:adenylate/guanylate cyclase domain-containing protein n=1 Tax=Argonema galeatum TaxID=2942762 RepID=UPI002011B5AC|nr:adenylate/guanylate cyclase domain-containing protein [Argonema galeatum]MCL1468256.1 PAS domain-containing protein [Argonema galeatum A003/A1]
MLLKALNRRISNVSKKMPLHLALVVPFVLQMVGAVGLTGYFSFKNGEESVNKVAAQFGRQISDRIQQNLQIFLATPYQINQTNQNLVTEGLLSTEKLQAWEKYLWRQVQSFDYITSISVTTTQGDRITGQFFEDGTKLISITEKRAGSKFHNSYIYNTNSKGDRTTLRQVIKNVNIPKTPRYIDSIKAGKPMWSKAYATRLEPTLFISATQPLYSQDGSQVRGLLNTSLRLDYIGKLLQNIKIGKSGQAFIIESSGKLLVTSTNEKPFRIGNNQRKPFKAVDSNNRLTRLTANYLATRFGDLSQLQNPQQLDFKIDEHKLYVQVLPLRDSRGLDWLIVVVIPKSDFMEEINMNTYTTIVLCIVALLITIPIGILTSRWVAEPILSLSMAAKAIAKGNLDVRVKSDRSDVLGQLAHSFNKMAQQLQESFVALSTTNQELEVRVAERTESLAAAEAELRGILAAMTEIILVFDVAGRCIKIVATNPQLLYKPVDEQLGKTIHEIFTAEQADPLLNHIQTSIKTQNRVNFEYSLTLGQQQVWFAASISPISENCAIWVARDITERKLMEEKVRSSESKIRAVFEAMTDVVLLLDIQGNIEIVPTNTALLYEPDLDVISYTIEQFFDDRISETWWQQIRRALDAQQTIEFDYSLTIDGREVWFAAKISPMLNDTVIWVARDISERQAALRELSQAEEALRQSEERNRAILAGLPDLVARCNKDGFYLDYRSPINFKTLVKGDTPIGKNFFEVLPPDTAQRLMGYIEQTLQIGEVQIFEQQVTIEGIVYDEEVRVVPSDEDEVLIVVRDVSTLKRLEKELSKSQQFLDSIVENIPLALFVKDVQDNFRYVLWNRTAEQVYAIPRERAIGHTLYDLVERELAEELIAQDREAIEKRELIVHEEIFDSEYQGLIWQRVMKLPLMNESGEVTYLIYIGEDITERKRAEEALRQSEERWQLALKGNNDGIFDWNIKTNEIFYSTRYKEILGYLDREMSNDYNEWASRLHPDDINRVMKTLLDHLDRKIPYYAVEYRQQCKDASYKWILSRGQALWDEEGNPVRMVGSNTDITERKQAEEALRIAQEKSESLLLNILPKAIADRLKQNTSAIAEHFEEATILFADIVGFTPLSAKMPPIELVNLLNEIFSNFDELADKHGLEKIKTIGDAYMVVGGLPVPRDGHAEAIAEMALDMQASINRFRYEKNELLQIRIGINTGQVVAGVIGIKKFIYDLWGDTVNVASRMESSGLPGNIQITSSTYELLQDKYLFEKRGTIKVKGKGEMTTYFLLGRRDDR